jgi:hypothetical protein
MKKTLKLEKRGCDFWTNGEEIKKSDLQNFRLCGFIESEVPTRKNKVGDFFIEISTGYHKKHCAFKEKNLMVTFFKFDYTDADGSTRGYYPHGYEFRPYCIVNKSTKAGVLEYINNLFKTDYTDIEIVENL